MNYPFEFNELLLTDKVLDVLGFTEYWSECGDFGRRTLALAGERYLLYQLDEKDDASDGYAPGPAEYSPGRFVSAEFNDRLYFLHDLYESINKSTSAEFIHDFIILTKKDGVNMWPALESYLKYKGASII